MANRGDLERALSTLAGFAHPRVDLEQYPTPAAPAAHLLHLASLRGDLTKRPVLDLGSGTGILAIGAVLAGAVEVIGLERDSAAIDIARSNEKDNGLADSVSWVRGDASAAPICPSEPLTVLMNPPFGAQKEHRHADRAFLETVSDVAAVSYSFHNAGSESFITNFVTDHGGQVTDKAAVEFDLGRQFDFHTSESRAIDVEFYRIEWISAEA